VALGFERIGFLVNVYLGSSTFFVRISYGSNFLYDLMVGVKGHSFFLLLSSCFSNLLLFSVCRSGYFINYYTCRMTAAFERASGFDLPLDRSILASFG